jgi:hypothetical protein
MGLIITLVVFVGLAAIIVWIADWTTGGDASRHEFRYTTLMLNQPFEKLCTVDQVKTLRALHRPDIGPHPLVTVALRPDLQTPSQVAVNTSRALHYVLRKAPDWAHNLRPRLLDANDWTNAESALAEIRACGALIEAGFPVQLGGRNAASGAKAEFHVSMDGVETIIEVWTRNLSNEDRKRILKEFKNSSRTEKLERGTIRISSATVTPFGAPDSKKKGDSVLTNAISRIAAIKEREHQAHDRRPFVLWIDLQSESAMMFDFSYQLHPLSSWKGEIQSGAYWYALYGRKGDTLLEPGGGFMRINEMKHEGRYYQILEAHNGPARISGCIFSTPRTTVLMEHPSAAFPLTKSFRRRLLELPWFSVSLSLANWSEHLVERIVAVQREYVSAVVTAFGRAG